MNALSPASRRIIAVALSISTLLLLAPLFMMLATSLKTPMEVLDLTSLLPKHPSLENYRVVMANGEEAPLGQWFLNSFCVAGGTTVLVLISSTLCAFALSRLKLPGSRWVAIVIIATMMIPVQVFLVPVYFILNQLHLLDTLWALILPASSGAFGVFLFYQFMQNIPAELEEAAMIDGCSALRIYWHVTLPSIKPAMATVGIFTFVGMWNDFLGPLVYLDSIDRFTLPVGIALFQTSYYTNYEITFACGVLATLPLLVLFFIFQKGIIESLSTSGMKE